MYVRISTVHGDKGMMDAAIEHIETVARPAVEATNGNRGFATFIDADLGLTVAASFWDDEASMRPSAAWRRSGTTPPRPPAAISPWRASRPW